MIGHGPIRAWCQVDPVADPGRFGGYVGRRIARSGMAAVRTGSGIVDLMCQIDPQEGVASSQGFRLGGAPYVHVESVRIAGRIRGSVIETSRARGTRFRDRSLP